MLQLELDVSSTIDRLGWIEIDVLNVVRNITKVKRNCIMLIIIWITITWGIFMRVILISFQTSN